MAEGRYSLGIDLGSSFVAAAADHGGRIEVLQLGERSELLPAAVGWRGELVAGDAAELLSLSRPDAVVRGLKSRVGDPMPIRLGGTTQRVEALLVQLLGPVAARAHGRFGRPPSTVVLTHPAGWGPFRCDALVAAAAAVGLRGARLVTDPVAAATAYLAGRQIREGRLVAVYDFGGHAFQASLLRRTIDGFQVVGRPEGFVDLGGADLDQRVFDFVRRQAGHLFDGLDPATPEGAAALAVVRRDCRLAKERLSQEETAVVLTQLPSRSFVPVQLTRAGFEDLVRGPLTATVEAFGELLDTAGIEPRALEATILVGGSSQIPLISRLLVEMHGVRPVPAGHPKFVVPVGATLVARGGETSPDGEDSTRIVTANEPARRGEPARRSKWWQSRAQR